jgi:hypothetical protein
MHQSGPKRVKIVGLRAGLAEALMRAAIGDMRPADVLTGLSSRAAGNLARMQ